MEQTQRDAHDQTHRDLTSLGITVGRLDERLASIHRSLEHHMREEHKDFECALEKVDKLHETVRDLNSAARVTRWIAMIVAALASAAIWIKDHIIFRS